MKTKRTLFLVPALIAVLNLIPAGRVTAQTFTTLHSFTGSDGAIPVAELDISGNTLYGTTIGAARLIDGQTVFAVHTDGTGFTTLHTFTGNDGFHPLARLVLSGNTLYGTTSGGFFSGPGVFALNTDGTGFTILHNFTNSDGDNPNGLILSGNTLYGTASAGGSLGMGTVFAVNTDGTGFTNLHNFTNSDGASPKGLTLSGNTLYGTASAGGSLGMGTVFALNTDGSGFTPLHSFTALSFPYTGTNSDGASPQAALILSGNTLYGTAASGGDSGAGTVFAVHTDGTGFTTLLNSRTAGLILSGNTLYGMGGAIFALNTDGSGFTNLYTFTGNDYPSAQLILSGDTFYGTASDGGGAGDGAVFSLSLRPQLTVTPSGTNVILSWPVSYAGFSFGAYNLQETSNLSSPNGWAAADPFPPIFLPWQYQVTRPMLGPQISYRLSQQ